MIQTSWMPFPMGIMNVKVVKKIWSPGLSMDLLMAAGRRGKGPARGKRTLGKRIEIFVEFTTVALK